MRRMSTNYLRKIENVKIGSFIPKGEYIKLPDGKYSGKSVPNMPEEVKAIPQKQRSEFRRISNRGQRANE